MGMLLVAGATATSRVFHGIVVQSYCGRPTMPIHAKRIYDPVAAGDGYRVLIDRMWPRGVSREHAALDEWARELAPSDELRRWFGHDPARFEEFARRYRIELGDQREHLSDLRRRGRRGALTILFAARDAEHSNAAVMVQVLRSGLR
jgi:uncharacterized protein YeaO (DUF488 family)